MCSAWATTRAGKRRLQNLRCELLLGSHLHHASSVSTDDSRRPSLCSHAFKEILCFQGDELGPHGATAKALACFKVAVCSKLCSHAPKTCALTLHHFLTASIWLGMECCPAWLTAWNGVLSCLKSPSKGLLTLQAQQVRLETANAALLEGSGASWDDAFDEQWSLVKTVMPEA